MIDFKEVKRAHSVTETAERLGVVLSEGRATCPKCGGAHNLVVTEGKGAMCFAADEGGDQIWLVAHVLDLKKQDGKLDFRKAAEWLAGKSKSSTVKESTVTVKSQESSQTTSAPYSSTAENGPRKGGFDRAKYQANLDRGHESLKDIPPDLLERADIGVSSKGALKGIVLPLYDKATGEFLMYAKVDGITLPSNVVKLVKTA